MKEMIDLLKQHPEMPSRDVARILGLNKEEIVKHYSAIQSIAEDIFSSDRYTLLTLNLLSSDAFVIEDLLMGKRVAPLILEIHPGRECQGKCEFCFSHEIDYEDAIPCSISSYLEAVVRSREMGVREVWFSGGKEPLTNPDTPALIAACNSLGFGTRLYTNGLLLDKYVSKSVLGSSQVRISLNAPDQETYEKIFGMNGSFVTVLDNITRLIKYRNTHNGPVNVSLSMIIQSANYDKIGEFVDLAESLGVDSVQFRFDSVNRLPPLTSPQKESIMQQMDELEKDPPSIGLDFRGFKEGEASGGLLPRLGKPKVCRAGLMKRAIDPFGNVWFCEFSSHPAFRFDRQNLMYGNIMHESISVIFHETSNCRFPVCLLCQAHEYGLNILLEKLEDDIDYGVRPYQQPIRKRRQASF